MKKGTSILQGRVLCFMLAAMVIAIGGQNAFAQSGNTVPATRIIAPQNSGTGSPLSKGQIADILKQSQNTISFVENKGQWNPQVLAIGNTNVGDLVVKKDHLYFLSAREDEEGEEHEEHEAGEPESHEEEEEHERMVAHGWGIFLDGYNPNFKMAKSRELLTKRNYFGSKYAERNATDVASFGELTLEDIYQGIDLRLYSQEAHHIEFDWLVAPGADMNNIKMRFKGQDGLSIDAKGSLSVKLRFDEVKFDIPESYQVIDGKKVMVQMAFDIKGDVVTFKVISGKIDNRYPLVIDPSAKWGTWFDNNDNNFDEYLFAVDVDAAGNVYCGGNVNMLITRNYIGSAIWGYDSTYIQGTSGNGNNRKGIIYQISTNGTSLLRITYFGNQDDSDEGRGAIYGLSLSPDFSRVFVCGYVQDEIPTTGNAFDNSRSGNDGFVAVLNANLNQLIYSTYIGGSGSDRLVTIRATSNTDYVVGGRVGAALPAGYISNAYQSAYSAGQDMYIAKFNNLNTLSWGTYVGGGGTDDLNDLHVFSDGAVAFCGHTNSTFATFPGLVNTAGSQNATTQDGVVGVIPSAGGNFSMLSRIGGSGIDLFNGLTIGLGDTLYVTGYTRSSNFPLGPDSSAGNRFRITKNNGTTNDDGIVGKLPRAGKSGVIDPWMATYFSGTSNDRGNTIRTYAQGTALMVFGETGSQPKTNAAPDGFPVKNLDLAGNTFYDSTYNGDNWDIFWLAIATNLKDELFCTYVGGNNNDYLGETGTPAGSNHFVVEGDSLIVLGTTVHSVTLDPTVIGPTSGPGQVFDPTNSTAGDDAHLIFKWRIGALFTFDYGDAPSSYGTGRHNILGNIRLGTNIDAEDFYPVTPGSRANVDDNTASPDDEDAIAGNPTQILIQDTATRYSLTIPITNTTGSTATVVAWIDFNRDGTFGLNEVDTNRVASGTTSTTFSWNISNWFTGASDTSYMRIRITTDAQANVANPPNNVNYSDGEVEDYLVIRYHCVDLTSAVTTHVSPSTCGGTNGSITISNGGLSANTGYLVTYRRNNVVVGPATFTTNGSGQIIIPNLNAALYTSINIAHPTNTACGDTADPARLVDPITPSAPNPSATPSTVCTGQSFQLSATGRPGATYSWSGPNGFNQTGNPITRTNVIESMEGNYTVTQTDSGCTSPPGTIFVTVNPTPGTPTNVTASPNDTLCTGATLTLSASGVGGATFNWSGPNSFSQSSTNPVQITNVTTANTGTYTVTQTAAGCTSTASGSVNVVILATPATLTVNATPNPLCAGDTLTLTASNVTGGATVTWSFPGGGTATGNPVVRNTVTVGMSGNYTATQTLNGCVSPASAPVNVVVNPRPTIGGAVGTNPTTCGGTDGFITISGLTPAATYSVNYLFNGNPQSASGLVANGSGQIIVPGLGAGAYTAITVTSAAGCTSPAFGGTVTLSSPATPPPPTVSSNSPVCENDTLKLFITSPAPGATFSWTATGFSSTDQNPVRPNATLAMAIQYCATQTVANCTSPASCTTPVVNPRPVINGATGSNPTSCGGTNGTITIGGLTPGQSYNVTYLRNGLPQSRTGLVANISGQIVITGLNQATYSNIVVTLNGCSSLPFGGTVSISDPAIPNTPAVGSNSPVCAGDTIKLTITNPSPGATFAWTLSTDPGYNSTDQNPVRPNALQTMGGNYCVTQTVSGCTSSSGCSIVIVNPKPTISTLIGSNPTTCLGTDGSITITGLNNNTNYTISYSKDAVPQGSFPFSSNNLGQIILSGLGAGTYNNFVVVNSLSNCISFPFAGTVTLTDPAIPLPPSLSSNTPCEGDTLRLFANGLPGATYSWTGSGVYTSPDQNPTRANANIATMAGSYCATQTINNCTSNPTCINVTINSRPTANAGIDTTVCSGKPARIGGNPTATGGTPNYTYTWTGGLVPITQVSNPIVTPTVTTGYNVLVTDNNGCTATSSVAVNVNANPVADAGPDVDLVSCDLVGVNIGGNPSGNGPFTYQWSPPAGLTTPTSQTPVVSSIGDTTTYTVTVTDNNGCTATDAVNVNVVGSAISVSISASGPVEWCEASGGSVILTANPIGGVPNYDYSWTGPGFSGATNLVSATANVQTAGTHTYSLVVTDNVGCQAGNTITITVNPRPIADAGPDITICNGQTDTIGGTPTGSGGTPGYTYSWSSGAGSDANPAVSPISNTNYVVTVTDSKLCQATDQMTVFVNQNPVANAGPDKDLPSCSPTGLLIGSPSTGSGGGGGPYNYSWTPTTGLFTSSSANPTVVGITDTTTYTVVVTDNNGCTASDVVTVNLIDNTPTVTISAGGPTEWCAGGTNNVNLTANVTGGTTAYTYSWSGLNISPVNAQNATANPNVAGTYVYFVTATDAFNCTAVATDTVIVNALPVANAGIDTTTCSASAIMLGGSPTATGGTPGYTYLWTGGATTANPTVNPTLTSSYTVTVTDSKLCSATDEITVTIRAQPTADAGSDVTLPSCSPTGVQIGGSPAGSGGSGDPFTYHWSPTAGLSDTSISNPTVSGITATQTYTLVVTDANGCTASDQVLVTVTNNPLIASISASGRTSWCANVPNSVNLTADLSGGSLPYSYVWSGTPAPSPTNTQTTTVSPNAPGTYVYTVVITDAFNCTATANRTITVDSVPTASAGPVGGFTTCSGTPVQIGGSPTATGGNPGYTYLWSNAAIVSNPTVTPLITTSYIVTVTDTLGCSATAITTVNVNPVPNANAGPDVSVPTCSPTGIQIGGSPTAFNGTAPYTYKWSPAAFLSANDSVANPFVVGLTNDTTYTVVVTDAFGCTATDQVRVRVVSNTPLVNVTSNNPNAKCFGVNTGPTNLSANVTGGTVPVAYLWSGSDIVGPSNTQVITVNPTAIGVYVYNVTITDAFNCTATGSITITIDSIPTADAGGTGGIFTTCSGTPVEIGGNPTASGGTPPYTYIWSGAAGVANPTVTPLSTTTYNLTVIDDKGCSATATTTVQVNQRPTADAGPDQTVSVCSGDSITIGGIPASATGGTPPYRYQWSPATGLSNDTIANPVVRGITGQQVYTLVVTDANGCTGTDVVVVNSGPNSLQVDAGVDREVCEGICSQLGTFPTVQGGTAPYIYSWTGAGLNFTNIGNPVACPAGTTTYTVVVTDAKGCVGVDSVVVVVNPNPTADAGPDTASCAGRGIVIGGNPTGSGGTGTLEYLWAPAIGITPVDVANPTATPAQITTYQVVVTDSKGCIDADDVIVTPRENPVADAGADKTLVACSGDSVRIGGSPTGSGGAGGTYQYIWSPSLGVTDTSVANPYVKNLATDAVYTINVIDSFGCRDDDQVFIEVTGSSMVVEAGNDAAICEGSNASISLGGNPTVSGGTPPYIYSWTGAGLDTSNKANPVARPLISTTYILQVVDANGCIGQDSVRITVNPRPIVNAGANDTLCFGQCVVLGGDSINPTASGGTAPYTYNWLNGTFLSCITCPNPTACPDQDITYPLFVTDSNGCIGYGEVFLKVSELTVDAGLDKTICEGQSVQIGGSPTLTGLGTINWIPGNLTAQNPIVSPTITTTYVVTASDTVGCVSIDTMIVVVNPAVQPPVLTDTALCTGAGTFILGGNPTGVGGTPPYQYQWSPGINLSSATAANPTITNPLLGGSWCVTVTDTLGCSASACQTISINAGVIADAGPDASMTNCDGDSLVIGGSPAGSGGSNPANLVYSWSPDSVAGVKVLFDPNLPNPVLRGLDTTTIFTLTVTDTTTGCFATDQVRITIVPSTIQADAGPDITICSPGIVDLGGVITGSGGTPGYTYQWSPDRFIFSANSDPTLPNPQAEILQNTQFIVTVTDSKGCQAVDSVNVTLNDPLVVTAGNDTIVCSREDVELGGNPTASGGSGSYTYVWSGGPFGLVPGITVPNPIAQNITGNANYTVVVTDGANCTASATMTIAVRQLPTANAGPDVSIFPCSGDSAILGGTLLNPTGSGTTAPYTYEWSPPFNVALNCLTCANPVVDSLGATTEFCVIVTDSFGCVSDPDCALITVLPKTIFVNARPDNLPQLCSNGNTCVELGARIPTGPVSGGVPPYMYEWFDANNDSISNVPNPIVCPTQTTTYTLIGTDSKGCQASDTVRIQINTAPIANITGLNAQYCVDAGNVTMTGVPAGGTFSGPGVTGNVFQPAVLGPGTYCIRYAYTDPLTNCSDDTIICVIVNPLPIVAITPPNGQTTYCVSDLPVIFTGTPAGGTFSGPGIVASGEFNPALAGAGTHVIIYTYTDPQTTCTNTATVTITVLAAPAFSITATADSVCSGATVTLIPTYGPGVTNVIWSQLGGGTIGAGPSNFTFTPSGVDYCVVGTAQTANCVARDTICIHVNQPPVANDDIGNTCENQPITIPVQINDTDPEGDANTITVLSTAHGTSTVVGGQINYTPDTDYNGLDTIIYIACNVRCPSNCDSATVIVNICAINNPPIIAQDEVDTICKNGVSTICPVVTDEDGNPYQVIPFACSGPVNGVLALSGDSCFTFTPNPGWTGTQRLCMRVCDNLGGCDTAFATIVVVPANDAPLAARINLNICAGIPIGINVAAATTDPNGDPVTFSYGIMTGPGAATWQVTGTGAAVFVSNTPGTYIMPYTVCDQTKLLNFCSGNRCTSNQVVITVTDCTTNPADTIDANDDGMVTTVNTPAVINPLANDFYPSKPGLPAGGIPGIISGPTLPGAQAVQNADGTITYTSPTPGYDSIVYVICDPFPLCDTAVIRIFVDTAAITNYPPIAVDDFDTTDYNTPIDIPVLRNDIDQNGNGIRVTLIPCPPTDGTIVQFGTEITYQPGPNANANNPDTFCYQICNIGFPTLCDTATVVIYIRNSVVAVNDTVSTGRFNPIVIDVLDNDFDPEGDSFGITGVITTNTRGTVTVDTNGTIRFVPDTDTCGYVDSFQYIIQDEFGAVDTGTVYIDIICCPKPVAIDDQLTILPGNQATIYPFANDIASTGVSGGVLVAPKHGVAFFTNDTTLSYTANANYCGPDTITYIGKSTCGIDTGLVVIDIYCVLNPKAVSDTEYICSHDIINIPVFKNDTVYNGNTLRITDISDPLPPNLGFITEVTENVITFATNGNTGVVRFRYITCDNGFVQLCDTAGIVIFIQDCPKPEIDTIYDTTYVNTPKILCPTGFVTSAGSWSITSLCEAKYGTAVVVDDTCILYTPDSNYVGNDTFCIIICDPYGCDTGFVIMTVLDTVKCYIPNAFSPNGDGVNDIFTIPCNNNTRSTLRIYDRWGMEVWGSNGPYQNDWDGRNQQGTILPDGTYYLIYEYNDGTGKRESRYVVIHR